MLKGLLIGLFACLAVANIVPSWSDNIDYDLVMLSETEASAAIPASLRLNPKVYESEDEAVRAAEKELSLLGESVDGSLTLKKIAEKEALNIAQDAEKDPMHDGMEGIKVDLGEMEDPEEKARKEREEAIAKKKAAKLAQEKAVVVEKVEKVEPEPAVDLQNEQENKPQFSEMMFLLLPMLKREKITPSKTFKKFQQSTLCLLSLIFFQMKEVLLALVLQHHNLDSNFHSECQRKCKCQCKCQCKCKCQCRCQCKCKCRCPCKCNHYDPPSFLKTKLTFSPRTHNSSSQRFHFLF